MQRSHSFYGPVDCMELTHAANVKPRSHVAIVKEQASPSSFMCGCSQWSWSRVSWISNSRL